MNRFLHLCRIASGNFKKTCWVLKCDIRQFFASIDHERLFEIIDRHGIDSNTFWLIRQVVESFDSGAIGKGLPLGNLTSQLFVNVYMNEFDQFIKHILKVSHYVRFADDFVIMSSNKPYLETVFVKIKRFLEEKLLLFMHPRKVFIGTIASGIDFLGWVHFTDHRVLRTATKRRMLAKLKKSASSKTMNSYLGLLNHGNAKKLYIKVSEFTKIS